LHNGVHGCARQFIDRKQAGENESCPTWGSFAPVHSGAVDEKAEGSERLSGRQQRA
jgi:hypothetical protein